MMTSCHHHELATQYIKCRGKNTPIFYLILLPQVLDYLRKASTGNNHVVTLSTNALSDIAKAGGTRNFDMMILFTATLEDKNAKYFMGKILERFTEMASAARQNQQIRKKVTTPKP